jgi:EAL and modified HD-GYP domain-containing signal transduction protein
MDAAVNEMPLVARQPILDRHGHRVAYELLYRGAPQLGPDADTTATARVLAESIGSRGVVEIAGSARLFVNFGQELLENPTIFGVLSPESVVIEVLESVDPSRRLRESILGLRARGFRIALDDFVYQPAFEPLVEMADYVKIDIQVSKDTLERDVQWCRRRQLQLVAEKVETYAQFSRCLALGFDLFQGYYFCRPETLSGKPLAPNHVAVLNLIAALQDPTIGAKATAAIIAHDVALAYQVLRLANSALIRRRREIANMHDAIVVLGHDALRNWATLLMLSRLASNKPSELVRTALVRAHMCSLLAKESDGIADCTHFAAGLLSVLDALLDRPMPDIVRRLGLRAELGTALLGDSRSSVGRVLQHVQAYEAGDWERVIALASDNSLRDVYFDALRSADEVLAALTSVGRRHQRHVNMGSQQLRTQQ